MNANSDMSELNSLNERLQCVQLPVTLKAKKVFRAMMMQNLARNQGEYLLITGHAGTGKSHLTQQLATLAEELLGGLKAKRPVISLPLNSAAGLKDFSRQLAQVIGNPVTLHRLLDKSGRDISHEVLNDLIKLGTRVLLVDEAHNLLLERPDAQSSELARRLKGLTYSGISIVFFALPGFQQTLSRYGELESRLYTKTPIQTGPLAGRTEEELDAAIKFLADVEAAFGVPADPHFDDPRIALPLVECSQGNLRDLMRIIQGAETERAARNGPTLTLDDFRQSANNVGVAWRDEP